MRVREQRGQVSAEYIGVLLLVAVIVGAFIASGLAGRIATGARDAVCRIAGGECATTAGPGTPTDRAAQERELERREQVLASMAGRGEGYAALLAQARAARERGDLDEADRLLDLVEFYSRLADNDRGDIVDAVNGPSDSAFDELVRRGTIEEDGGRNRRYFRVPPSPGDGIVVRTSSSPARAPAACSRATTATRSTRCSATRASTSRASS